jgi:hypothetical protein
MPSGYISALHSMFVIFSRKHKSFLDDMGIVPDGEQRVPYLFPIDQAMGIR